MVTLKSSTFDYCRRNKIYIFVGKDHQNNIWAVICSFYELVLLVVVFDADDDDEDTLLFLLQDVELPLFEVDVEAIRCL